MLMRRRHVLRGLAGVAAWGAVRPGLAGETRVARLIAETQNLPAIAQRIDVISAALRGTRYEGETLIGSPRRPERFVLRDDAFDCVTYVETVLAAARSHDIAGFEDALREIRYRKGYVNWFERNHYFFEWCEHNVDNKICRWVDMTGSVQIKKTVNSQKGLSKRRFVMRVIPRAVFLANAGKLETGDIVGFVSQRSDLDYFHCGLVVRGHTLLLRHASETRRRVLDESMAHFFTRAGAQSVTVVRPQEVATA